MAESKKHHYVPQSLLRGFAIPGTEQVHVFDKKAMRVYKGAIADVGAENRYNTLEIQGQSVNAECAFNEHDTRLADLLRKLRAVGDLSCLTEDDRVQVAYAAAIQRLRVRLVRTTLAAFPQQLRKIFEEAGAEYSPEVAPDLDENQIKAMSFRMLKDAERFVPAFLKKHWLLHTTTLEEPFWISDSPIVTVNILPWGDTGLESRGVEIAWPISSTLVLSFLCPSMSAKLERVAQKGAEYLRSSPTIRSNPDGVLFYNSLQVLQSSRYLYSATDEFRHARRILDENPAVRHIETSMVPTGIGQAPPSRMPPGRWLVITGARTHHCCGVESWTKRDNRLFVKVVPSGEASLRAAIMDGPHDSVQLFDDAGPSWMLRLIELTLDPKDGHTVVIAHDGPPL